MRLTGSVTTRVSWLLIGSLGVGVAFAQSQQDKARAERRARMERLFDLEERAAALRPYRREAPVRDDNIRDAEVQEILAVMARIRPGEIVNIGTIVSGCPCEDGPSCRDQVWVVANGAGRSAGLLLSRINAHWSIGAVQQWWLEREDLIARRSSFDSSFAYVNAEDALTERFPACLERK